MASFAAGEFVFDALLVGFCEWGGGHPCRTNLGSSPTALPTHQVPLSTFGPMQTVISDFSAPPYYLMSSLCHRPVLLFSLHFLPCCNLSAVFLTLHSGVIKIHHLQPLFLLVFTCVDPPIFYFCLKKHVSVSPEKQKRN